MQMKGTQINKLSRLNINNQYSYSKKMSDDQVTIKLSFRQKLALFCLGLFSVLLTVFVFAPVVWLSMFLQSETNGRLVLDGAEGTLWNGSAFIGVSLDKSNELTSLLPGRFEWHLSPILFLGQVELVVKNAETLQQPLYIDGNFRHIQISPGSIVLPANRLAALGAPINTIKPSGQMTLSWDALGVTFPDRKSELTEVNGRMLLAMEDIASALSPVKPLGSYVMSFNWHGSEADIDLTTSRGPMLLSGKGTLVNGHLRFSGLAQSEKEQEDRLANLLNLLGQHRPGANKNVISLEFK